MKSTTLALFICLIGCASSTTNNKPVVAHNPSDYVPPTDFELTVKDKPQVQQEVVMTEEQIYQNSLDQLRTELQDENLQLQMCNEIHHNGAVCKSLQRNLCETDELVDIRGGRHKKPYCKVLTK